MKKTLFTLAALSGVAAAATIYDFTLDNAYVVNGTEDLVSAVDATLAGGDTYLQTGVLNQNPLTTTVTLSQMLDTNGNFALGKETYASNPRITLSSIQIVSRNGYRPADATITISVGGQTYESETAVYPSQNVGLTTFTFAEGVVLSADDTLTFTINKNNSALDNFGYTGYSAKNATAAAAITFSGDQATYSGWHMATRINGTVTPEPATATLSLLALAGLAARRRRH